MKTRVSISSFVVVGFLALGAASSRALADGEGFGWNVCTNPAVSIVSPQEGQAILVGNNIFILAATCGFTDAVTSVEFFAGTNSLGTTSNSPSVWGDDDSGLSGRGFFSLTWSNAAAGGYALTAVASDLAGNSVTSAPVDITVVTDLPPVVRIVKPRNGSVIVNPTNLVLVASAFDRDGSGPVASVEFFEGTNSLGVVTNPPPLVVSNNCDEFPVWQSAYSFTWSNVAFGNYSLTAVATDNAGLMSTSSVVNISIVSNLPPFVRIIRPYNYSRFTAPATINIRAITSDEFGTVSNVEFFEGTNSLGTETNGLSVTNDDGKVWTWFGLSWKVVAAGTYTLTAVATDDIGGSSTSAPVHILVCSPPPPAVRIVRPFNDARFVAPANICISAETFHFTNSIASIQFLSGTNTVGVVSNPPTPASFVWTNVAVGHYALSAVATDTGGVMATSPAVNITVCTNQPSRASFWGGFWWGGD